MASDRCVRGVGCHEVVLDHQGYSLVLCGGGIEGAHDVLAQIVGATDWKIVPMVMAWWICCDGQLYATR